MHGIEHNFVLAHTQVIIAAPVGDALDVVRSVPHGVRELALFTNNVVEHTIFARVFQGFKQGIEWLFVYHSNVFTLLNIALGSDNG